MYISILVSWNESKVSNPTHKSQIMNMNDEPLGHTILLQKLLKVERKADNKNDEESWKDS